MKLTAEIIPYSSVVGGGLSLLDEKGRVRFVIMLRGSTEGITKRESDQITEQLATMIHRHGIEVFE